MKGKEIGMLGVGAFIIVVLLGFGVVLSDILGYEARDSTTTALNEITVATNGSLTAFGSSYPYVQTVTGCVNSTDATVLLGTGNYTVVTGNEDGNGGFVLSDSGAALVGNDVNCTVTYLKTTDGTTASVAIIVLLTTVAGLTVLAFFTIIGRWIFKGLNNK